MITLPSSMPFGRGLRLRAFHLVMACPAGVAAAFAEESGDAIVPPGSIQPEPYDVSALGWVVWAMVLLMVGIFLYLARKGTFFPYGAAGLSTMGLGALVVLRWKMELTSLKGISVFVVWTITLLLLVICAVRSIGVGRHSKVAGPVAIFALISVMLSVVALFLLLAPWRE